MLVVQILHISLQRMDSMLLPALGKDQQFKTLRQRAFPGENQYTRRCIPSGDS
eukprot:XP_001709020.1 Hypothetical protein GL50803_21787 [Giardia lamblia ATCC 50803]